MAYIQDWGMRVQAQPQINTTRRAFLHLSQNENGRMLNIRITDANIPAGSTAVLAGTKPDGTVYSQAGTLSGNTATFAEDVQMTAVVGTWDAKITVTNGGNCICTARITITIDPDTVAGGAIPSDSQLDGIIAECRAIADSVRKEAYGSPLVADAIEAMTDQSRVYVYTGSESGMTAGHWYYYNGSAWTDGGVYNAVAVDTDTTLTISGKAADAKEVGDQLTSVKENLQDLDGEVVKTVNGIAPTSGNVNVTADVDAVTDAQSMSDMTDTEKLYRYDGKIYYYNGTEWTEVGTGEGGEIDPEILDLLVEDVTTKDYFVASNYKVDTHKYINTDGSISEETAFNNAIYAFPVNDYQGVAFHTIKGPRGTYVAFYTATNYAGCNADTFISAVNYPNDTDCVYDFPEGTKMCLLNSRGDVVGSWYYYSSEKVSKCDVEIAEFRDELNTEIGTTMNVHNLGTFVRGRLNDSTGAIISSNTQCISSEDIIIDRTIQISFDNDIYRVYVYYNNGDDTYSNNGGQNTEFARTIIKGSAVRINIQKRDATFFTDGELITIPHAVTFNTALEDWKEYVNDNCDYEAVCAKMFEKGGSEKTFSNAVGILAAGQSNINGRVPSSSLPSDIVPPFANIKNSINSKNGTFSNSMSLPSSWGVDFSLYDALNKLGQDFYVVKWSEGGTSISPYGTGTNKWTPFYEELDSISKSLLWSFEEQIRACLANNPNTFNPRALIWHQGEGDFYKDNSGSKKAALAYYKNFKCLIAYIRGIVGNERLPIIYGTISHNSGQYCPVVEEAQLKIAQEDPYAYCIDMSGAGLIDSYHFDADACVYFGRMAYDALIDFGVIPGTKINPTRPW